METREHDSQPQQYVSQSKDQSKNEIKNYTQLVLLTMKACASMPCQGQDVTMKEETTCLEVL